MKVVGILVAKGIETVVTIDDERSGTEERHYGWPRGGLVEGWQACYRTRHGKRRVRISIPINTKKNILTTRYNRICEISHAHQRRLPALAPRHLPASSGKVLLLLP